jgi:hypothetical protein
MAASTGSNTNLQHGVASEHKQSVQNHSCKYKRENKQKYNKYIYGKKKLS